MGGSTGSSLLLVNLFLQLLLLSSYPASSRGHGVKPAPESSFSIKTIYNFGDSISDTGNLAILGPPEVFPIASFPYGQTIKNATGRCSNGLLMIDYIANAFGLPHLNPYLDKDADFTTGVNFAMAGATALDSSILDESKIYNVITNNSLGIQLEWFKNHLSSKFSSKQECAKHLEHALIMMGEIGGNDYNYAFLMGQPISQVVPLVPLVVQRIINATKELIDLGARNVVVPGNFPIGCMTSYLSSIKNLIPKAFDKNNCLRGPNKFAMQHNRMLQKELKKLRKEYPHIKITYADYYHTFIYLLKNAQTLGFDLQCLFKACCGTGGLYNFDAFTLCGTLGTSVCSNPDRYISWDGIHLTQNAYRIMANVLIHDGRTFPCYRQN